MNIQLHINPNSGTPLYRQIADEVKSAFLRGYLKPGQKLPSVRELASQLGINPTTVVKAYDLLANERLLIRRQGKGAFVADGQQPLLPGERQEQVQELAHRLAIEALRLGFGPQEILAEVQSEIQKLLPKKESES